MPKPRKLSVAENQRLKRQLVRRLRVVAIVAVIGAVSAGVLISWEQLFPIPEDKLVNVYFTHSCRCAHSWVQALQAEGFVVKMFEPETLKPARAALHTPASLNGCHVAEFMGYFIEGHAPAVALRRLATEHPAGTGIAMLSPASKAEGGVDGPVGLVDQEGISHAWIGEPQR